MIWLASPRLFSANSRSSFASRKVTFARASDWLYLPETLYAFMLIMVISAGAGPYSLDAAILSLINHRAG
ncbi:MAG TPA: hypothetical protein VHY34_07015 [Caulobacteraceae bacterium]|nr:hypothetical protein [Caulobacteraceae bacterium]